ncbi:MAG: EAL domain-containing protein [Rhodobacteraceae bacterium]|nr:EAL domain-containing protein [Paracoccaceae bacterium]
MTEMPSADLPEGVESPLDAALTARDRRVLDMVRAAVRHDEAVLAYQPVMQARAPHRVAFYEGLVRVLDPTGRVIPAKDFMPLVEDTALGRELDCAALRMGLATLAAFPDLRLSLNMSARSIGYAKWRRTLDEGLAGAPTAGERLILEITETSAMTVPELVIDFMDDLQSHGIAFALDDFGAGVTAFRYFKDFFFDAVKIDGQFIRGIDSDPGNQVLTKALVSIARHFDMFVVAESVERPEEAAFLSGIGVDCLQGYLFAAPTVRPPWLAVPPDRAIA